MGVGAVFKLVGGRGGFGRQLVGFAQGNKAATEFNGNGGGEDETAGLDGGDGREIGVAIRLGEGLHGGLQGAGGP